jgi:methionine synthase II (cobalamin-independent)
LYLSSNCELEFLPRDVARQKVLRLGEAAVRTKELVA